MLVLVIDNYDSFTYNLCHLIWQVTGDFPLVRKNDELTIAEVKALAPEAIVLSPGPGHPARERDFGICADVLKSVDLPVLGVCLGHQGIAQCSGAAVLPAVRAMHGLKSFIFHQGAGLFEGIPQGFAAVRYHSFIVAEPLPEELEILAWTGDREIMALRHRSRPFWGVQFHPESIETEHGACLLENFFACARSFTREQRTTQKHFDFYVDPEQAYLSIFAGDRHSYWLDSTRTDSPAGRFSFMGGCSIPGSFLVEYDQPKRQLRLNSVAGCETREEQVFDYLRRELRTRKQSAPSDAPFSGGFVGYLGFELKGDCGYSNVHRSEVPDARLLYSPAVLAFDHVDRTMSLNIAEDSPELLAWADCLEERLKRVPASTSVPGNEIAGPFVPRQSAAGYRSAVQAALAEIAHGESYEVCLTDLLEGPVVRDPLAFYRRLRVANPAPYGAFLRFGDMAVACSSPERFLRVESGRKVTAKPIKGTVPRGVAPEQDKANKAALASSTKDAAEHLMIVDLVRNDLGRVCEPGSVSVPLFREIESYAKVHHMVSTIQGTLRRECNVIDAIQAAFPGGSMSGAPKGRTLEILDRLEAGARGIYSGSIGWLGVNGCCDLNIVIRTAVMTTRKTEIGSGGAIVALSDPDQEREELLLKVEPLLRLLNRNPEASLSG